LLGLQDVRFEEERRVVLKDDGYLAIDADDGAVDVDALARLQRYLHGLAHFRPSRMVWLTSMSARKPLDWSASTRSASAIAHRPIEMRSPLRPPASSLPGSVRFWMKNVQSFWRYCTASAVSSDFEPAASAIFISSMARSRAACSLARAWRGSLSMISA